MKRSNGSQNSGDLGSQFQHACRPSKNELKKSPRITLRLTEVELTQLKHVSAGMSVSAYIRKCVFGSNAAPRKVRSRAPLKNEKSLAHVLGLLGRSRIANNLNQLAKEAHSGSLLLDEETQVKIDEAYRYVCFMRNALVSALGIVEGDQQ